MNADLSARCASALLGTAALTLCMALPGSQSFQPSAEPRAKLTPIGFGNGEIGTAIPSLPYTITKCGRYYLTKCLTGVIGENGITIDADDVTLDLNGFTLTGVPGSLDGVKVVNDRRNITVEDGVIRSWGGNGLNAAASSAAIANNFRGSSLTADQNGADGLRVGRASVVSHCVATENLGSGIRATWNAVVVNCVADGNGRGSGYYGIFVEQSGAISACATGWNDGTGIWAHSSAVTGNAIRSNIQGGVDTQNSLVMSNASTFNGVFDYDGHGNSALVDNR